MCTESGYHDSAVYVLCKRETFSIGGLCRARNTDNKESNGEAPWYGYNDIGVLRPPHISERVSAQSSLFTIGKNPEKPIKADWVIRIPSKKEIRTDLLRSLDDLGINKATLFPDLDGASSHLTRVCRYWNPERGVTDKEMGPYKE